MDAQNRIAEPALRLPKGGGALRGLGQAQQPNPFTGGMTLAVPVPAPPARGLEPHLALGYAPSGGNGPFGIGFGMDVPSVTRATHQHIPYYDDRDAFLLSGEENLVPALEERGGAWVPVERTDGGYRVVVYRPKVETDFPLVERWILRTDPAECHWRVVDRENTESVFGRDAAYRVTDPADPGRIYQWLLQETTDPRGNRIAYAYKQEDGQGLPPWDPGQRSDAVRYLRSVRYGNYVPAPGQDEVFAFEVRLDYGEWDWSTWSDANPWATRADPFSTYRPGFELRTRRLCRNVLVFHHFTGENGRKPFLARALRLEYRETPVLSFLASVTEVGYRPRGDGGYDAEALPALTCDWSPFTPAGRGFQPLEVEGQGALPGGLGEFMPVDLYGEGLPGFLYADGTVTQYWRPEGGGRYAPAETPPLFPLDRDLAGGGAALADLDANSQVSVVVSQGARQGYYLDRYDGRWRSFTPFEAAPAALADPAAQHTDVDGSGRASLLVLGGGEATWYRSRGFAGYDAPRTVPLPDSFPVQAAADEWVAFADLVGDGLSHRVRVRDGQVEVWPELGYGRYGGPVLLGNAPRFPGGFDPGRLYLADLDGAGPADLVYALEDRVAIYLNQSGNGFAEPVFVELPAPYGSLSEIRFLDVAGNGTSALVFTVLEPEVRHWYCLFTTGRTEAEQTKPYLLTGYANGLGAEVSFAYASSTWFYLQDRRAGRAWPTRLPFPVQVVRETAAADRVSGTVLTTRHAYHDGYYDFTDRRFRGFGYVESWDAESLDEFAERFRDQPVTLEQLNRALFAPPRLTRAWYHIGGLENAAAVERAYRAEFSAADPDAQTLPWVELDPALDRDDGRTMRHAYEALNGRLVRQEVYALDGAGSAPVAVTEASWYVQRIQPRGANRYPVLAVPEHERLEYAFEGDPADPRLQHVLTLEVDDFAQPVLSATVSYPRRPAAGRTVLPEQAELRAVAERTAYYDPAGPDRWIGVPREAERFELDGLDLRARPVFGFAQLLEQVRAALQHVVPYGAPWSDAPGPQARQLAWERSYYWNAAQDAALPLDGPLPRRALPHHQAAAVFTPAVAEAAFGGRLTPAALQDEGGYLWDEATGYYWNRGLVSVFQSDPAAYYVARANENAFVGTDSPLYSRTRVEYDAPYRLAPVLEAAWESAGGGTPVENVTTAEIDYAVLAPWRLVDPNGNVAEVRFSPRGEVVLHSVYKPADGGHARQGDGGVDAYGPLAPADFAAVLADPRAYLKDVTAYFYYDADAWRGRGQPTSAIAVQRVTHVSDPGPGGETALQVDVAYFDGALRGVEQKRRVPLAAGGERWLASSRVVLNNKGDEAERYLPYYAGTPDYESQAEVAALVPPPTVTRYDALRRPDRVFTPRGFFRRTEYGAWETREFDEDDTVLDSDFYRDNYSIVGPDEKDALDKAAVFFGTPAVAQLDNLGRTVRAVADALGAVPRDAFTFCQGTGVTSAELWDALVKAAYLDARGVVAPRFQPYTPGFALELPPPYDALAAPALAFLRPGRLTTYLGLDAAGLPLVTVDPRLYAYDVGLPQEQWRVSFRVAYGMDGTPLRTWSADAGDSATARNVYGKPFRMWTARGYEMRYAFDALQRPTAVSVSGTEQVLGRAPVTVDALLETLEYGEAVPDAAAANLRGQLYRHRDQAGVAEYPAYTFQDQVQRTTRQLLADWAGVADWRQDPALGPDLYAVEFAYDALLRITRETLPDGTVYLPAYTPEGWLASVDLRDAEGTLQPVAGGITYDAGGQRLHVSYGNGAASDYTYEPTTRRLASLASTGAGGAAVQATQYTYDPVGNVTRTGDTTYQLVFTAAQPGATPAADYTCDALYRVLRATGRQHTGIRVDTWVDGFKQSLFAKPDEEGVLEEYADVFTYDDAGNLVARAHAALSASWSVDQPVLADSNRLAGAAYDAHGNTLGLTLGAQAALSWTVGDQLASAENVVHAGGQPVAEYYRYDAKGYRLRTVTLRPADGATEAEREDVVRLGNYERRRVYRLGTGQPELVEERLAAWVRDDRRLVAVAYRWPLEAGGASGRREVRWQLDNYLRSTCVELDAAAALLSYEEYDAYGGTAVVAGPDEAAVRPKQRRFTGKERLDTTCLYDYGLRWYAPWEGRWMSPDPAGPVDGLNLYAFVTGNPVTLLDPDGLCGDQPQHQPAPHHDSGGSRGISPTGLYQFATGMVFMNTFFEMAEGMVHRYSHGRPPTVISTAMKTLVPTLAARAAMFGGLSGGLYASIKVSDYLRKGEYGSAFTYSLYGAGSAFFAREGYLTMLHVYAPILKPVYPRIPHVTQYQISMTGVSADAFKTIYSLLKGDAGGVIKYSLLGSANWKTAQESIKPPRGLSPAFGLYGLALMSQLIPSGVYDEYIGTPVGNAVKTVKKAVSSQVARIAPPPSIPDRHWTDSSNVNMESLRRTASFRNPPTDQ